MILPLVGAGPSAIDPLAGYLIYDTFADANGTALADHTPEKDGIGGGWSYLDGSGFTIQSNKLEIQESGDLSMAVIDSGQADIKITGDVTQSGEAFERFFLRVVDINNYVECIFDRFAVGSMCIRKRVATVLSVIATLSTSICGSGAYSFEITASGTTITMKDLTNSKTLVGTVVELTTATIVGVGDTDSSVVWTLDNFSVTL